MTTDKRNGLVVMALVLSLTVGVGVLFLLEPGKHLWRGDTTLIAEARQPVDEVEILCAGSLTEAQQLFVPQDADGVCVVYPDKNPRWLPGGPRVWLLVVGTGAETLPDAQKIWLLGALRDLTGGTGAERVRIRLAPPLDASASQDLPKQADDLRQLLQRKQLLAS